jgi:hypothetical protein
MIQRLLLILGTLCAVGGLALVCLTALLLGAPLGASLHWGAVLAFGGLILLNTLYIGRSAIP